MSLYNDLGVAPGADDAAIKRAYRKRAAKAHPDAGGSREDFERITQAKLILLDPRRRQKYDETGETDAAPDNEAAEILNVATAAIDFVLTRVEQRRADPCTFDIIKDARSHVDNLIDQQKEVVRGLEKGVVTLTRIAERMKPKADKPNRLRPIFEARILDHQRRVATTKAAIERMKSAWTLLGEHTFDANPRAEAAGWQGTESFAAMSEFARLMQGGL